MHGETVKLIHQRNLALNLSS